MDLPARIETPEQLDEVMTAPTPEVIESMRACPGDLLILGVAGKMGPTLAVLARRAMDAAGVPGEVIGVARFSDPQLRGRLESRGIRTISADLLDPAAVGRLPEAPHVVFMAGRKFGSTGDEPLTWAMNVLVPARVAERFGRSRIVALSTGNVYPLTPADGRGPAEDDPVGPVGEYAQSCLGRERVFQYFSARLGTPAVLVRLNYAIDLRYGVLTDIAGRVASGRPVDLTMGRVNVIWQGDANAAILRCLTHCASPPLVLNLTGPESHRVRDLAGELGRRLDRRPVFSGQESPDALLSCAERYVRMFGPPRVSIGQMLDWVAHWTRIGGPTLGKPTHFEARDGRF